MEKFTKADCKAISEDIQRVLEAVANKHGVKLVMGSGSFSEFSFTKKVEFRIEGEQGEDKEAEAKYRRNAHALGLKPEWFGVEFDDAYGNRLKVVGINTRRRANPVEIVNVLTGKKYKASTSYIKYHIMGG